jgi:DNA-binding CsgD family transcriptional regulator
LPLLWRMHLALGKCYRVQRRYEAAEENVLAARDLTEQLAFHVPGGSLRADFLHNARGLLSLLPPTPPRRAAKRAYDGLTGREREIAARIARGQSSREIADALVISERTVETHIGNILSKLGGGSPAHRRCLMCSGLSLDIVGKSSQDCQQNQSKREEKTHETQVQQVLIEEISEDPFARSP